MSVGLLEACADPQLLNFPLWPKQRDLLASVEAGPRTHVWALGRRCGKTTMAALVAVWDCLFRPHVQERVRPGERRYAMCVATNREQARLLVRAAKSIVENSPLLADLVEQATEDEVAFVNGTALRAFPCSSRGGRGWPISTLVMDEAAHFLTETDGYQTAERVWEALAPSTAQFGADARVIVSSTPYGTDGLFASLFEQAESGELPDARAHRLATGDVNPTIDLGYLASEERRNPGSFRAEYLAEFTSSGDAYLDFERFEIAPRGALPPDAGTGWIVGIDPAFSRDPFGVAVVGRSREHDSRLVLGYADAFRPHGDFSGPVDAVADVCRRYDARAVTDQFAAVAVVERLEGQGVSVRAEHISAPTKTAAFSELRARLYDGTLELYEHPDLVAELRRLRTRFTAGQAAVTNPRVGGSHGDIAQALALAVQEHAQGVRITTDFW